MKHIGNHGKRREGVTSEDLAMGAFVSSWFVGVTLSYGLLGLAERLAEWLVGL